MDFKSIGNSVSKGCHAVISGTKQHAPEILVTVGIAAGVGAVVTAITGTVKAKKLIDEKKAELGVDKLSAKDTVKTVWKCYIPTFFLATGSAVSVAAGAKVSIDRTAVMGTMYNVAQKAYNDHKEAVKEEVGEETAKKINEKAAEKKISEVKPSGNVALLGDGEVLFCDSLSGRVFRATKSAVEEKRNDFNQKLLCHDMESLNGWYDMLDEISPDPVEQNDVGDMLYWHITTTGQMRLSYHCTLYQNRLPCVVIDYDNPPVYFKECQ